jgi:hypothetical protein
MGWKLVRIKKYFLFVADLFRVEAERAALRFTGLWYLVGGLALGRGLTWKFGVSVLAQDGCFAVCG